MQFQATVDTSVMTHAAVRGLIIAVGSDSIPLETRHRAPRTWCALGTFGRGFHHQNSLKYLAHCPFLRVGPLGSLRGWVDRGPCHHRPWIDGSTLRLPGLLFLPCAVRIRRLTDRKPFKRYPAQACLSYSRWLTGIAAWSGIAINKHSYIFRDALLFATNDLPSTRDRFATTRMTSNFMDTHSTPPYYGLPHWGGRYFTLLAMYFLLASKFSG